VDCLKSEPQKQDGKAKGMIFNTDSLDDFTGFFDQWRARDPLTPKTIWRIGDKRTGQFTNSKRLGWVGWEVSVCSWRCRFVLDFKMWWYVYWNVKEWILVVELKGNDAEMMWGKTVVRMLTIFDKWIWGESKKLRICNPHKGLGTVDMESWRN
jgi:hypothetical protein